MTSLLSASTEESIVLTLFDIVNYLAKNGETMSQRAGLTVQQWILLLQVAGDPNFSRPGDEPEGQPEEKPGVMASTIARDRGVTRSSVSAQVTALIHKGLLTQIDDPQDRRRKVLRITRRGKRALEAIEPARRGANRALFRGSSPEELRNLQSTLLICLRRLAGRQRAEPQLAAKSKRELQDDKV